MLRFTGSPFVDAGLAGMCSAAGVESVSELDDEKIQTAVTELLRLLTSSSAFVEKLVANKKKTFATSEMSVIFPNGPYANPAVKLIDKPRRYMERVQAKLELALNQEGKTRDTCFVTGDPAKCRLGNDEFPLVDSKAKRNFHPGHLAGHAVSGTVALALEFFPLSVMRTGTDEGLFWFIHTADEELAISCADITHRRMNELIARGEKLGFYGDWRVASRAKETAFVALIRDVMSSGGQSSLRKPRIQTSEVPITAFTFTNNNKSAEISGQDLPHELFRYFAVLGRGEEAVGRLQAEVLQAEHICWRVSRAMLSNDHIISYCCIPKTDRTSARLRGGWEAHSLYATEVMRLSGQTIRAVEDVSERIFESDDRKDTVLLLRKKDVRIESVLLRLVRKGLMSDQEYQYLVPPENRYSARVARDYLLAALFERESCSENGVEFLRWPVDAELSKCDKHPMLTVVEAIGDRIMKANRASRATASLAKAQRISELRGVFLDFTHRGFMGWAEFVYLFPPDEGNLPAYAARDYLRAFLFSRQREQDHEPEDSETTPEGGK